MAEQVSGRPMGYSNRPSEGGLVIVWAPTYRPAWDTQPEAYVEHSVVAWGKSRRLAKASDTTPGLTAYFGVNHFDPGHWHLPGEPRAVFFLSLFVQRRTISLHTYSTCQDALAALHAFHTALIARTQTLP